MSFALVVFPLFHVISFAFSQNHLKIGMFDTSFCRGTYQGQWHKITQDTVKKVVSAYVTHFEPAQDTQCENHHFRKSELAWGTHSS